VAGGDGFSVDIAQIRAHAGVVEQIADRFGAVEGASAHISGDESAYGFLCGWIAAVLEGRHAEQDALFEAVRQNLVKVAQRLRETADRYESVEADIDDLVKVVDSRVGGGAG
jgi:hypothetical protein